LFQQRIKMEEPINATEKSLGGFPDDNPDHSNEKSLVPELPPGLALMSGKSTEEILADLNKHPLFMTELEENDDVAALQALAYEGTPLENATNFKEQGNGCFKEKRWADAKEFYGKGILILAAEERRRAKKEPPKESGSDDPEEIGREKSVLEQLFVNRAACHLELKNYRSCTMDCAGALGLNPRNVKAYYRSSKALLALGNVEKADEACARGLALDASNAALKVVADEIIHKAKEVEEKQRQERARLQKKKHEELLLRAALKARNIRTRTTDKPPEMEDAKLGLVPDPGDPRSSLSFPTLLLYPLHLESDFIKAFNETETLEQHLAYVFPLPWDQDGLYDTAGVECYMEAIGGRLVKVGKKVPLLEILGSGRVEIVDDVVKIFVVPRAVGDEWVQEYKARKDAELDGSRARV
jgi:tetratricopeptide (TPR) repeat protein